MGRRIKSIETWVLNKITPAIFNEIFHYVQQQDPILWGKQQPRHFLRVNLLLSFFKDMKHLGFNSLLNSVKDMDFRMNHKSFQHNTKVLRQVVATWAESQIQLGTLTEWTTIARHIRTNKHTRTVCLWIDSVDIAKQKHKGGSKKDLDWSYKKNKPGRRYMFLRDAKGKVRKLWGGYSPKFYDGNFVELFRRFFEVECAGAGIVGDTHFEWGRDNIHFAKFVVPYPQPSTGKRKRDGEGIAKLSKEKEEHNKAVRALRARVEDTFGTMEDMFLALKFPWAEEDSQMDCLVVTAAAIYNRLYI